MKDGGSWYYLHSDHLGGTALTTKTDGTALTHQNYYNARYYDPGLGQFVSPDTIVPDPGRVFDFNRYMMVRGNPLKYSDPSGNFPILGAALILTGVALMVTADSPLSPEEAAKTEGSARLGAALATGDANDVVTVVAGYDYIADEPVPYFSGEWFGAGAMAVVPGLSGSLTRVAFGMTDYLPALKRVAPDSLNYKDLGLNPNSVDFADQLLGAMNQAENIDFTISGMRQLTGADGVLTGSPGLNIPGSTNWELRTIWDNPELRRKTTFYRDGEVISPEEILNLD